MALLLLFGQSLGPFTSAAHTQNVASALAPSHLPMGNGHARLQPGSASPTQEVEQQPWMEQAAAAALPSTGDDSLTAAPLPTDAACDVPTSAQAHTSHALSPISGAPEDQRAMANDATTVVVPSLEEEAAAAVSAGQASSAQGETVESCSIFQGTLASLFLEQSCALCPAVSSAADSAQDFASGYAALPATGAETGVLANPTFTEHPVVIPEEAQLVCTASLRPETSLEDVMWREMAVHSLMCPAIAVATSDSAEAAIVRYVQGSAEHREDADPAVPLPAQPFPASHALMQAAAISFAAAADANEVIDASLSPFQCNDAACADHTLQQCSSAAAAALHPGVSVTADEPFSYSSIQENQLVVANIISQTTTDQTLISSLEIAGLPSDEVIDTDSGRPNSPFGAFSQLGVGPTAALAAEVQPMLQQDNTQDSMMTNSNLYMQLQTAPYTDRVAHPQPPSCGATLEDLSTLDAHAAPDVTMAADLAAVSDVPSQPHAGTPMFDQSPGTARLRGSFNSIADSAEAADAANVDATIVLPASTPEAAVLDVVEDPNAALAAELATMMTHAAAPSAPIAQVSESGACEQCEDDTAAVSCTDSPAVTLSKPTEPLSTAVSILPVPAGNVGPGAASQVWAAALAEQELACAEEQDDPAVADAAYLDVTVVLPASTPEAADLGGDEDPKAALAAELAAMMTHAAEPSACIAQASESGTSEQCEDDAAISCTDTLAATLLDPSEIMPIVLPTMSMPAGRVVHGAASMWAAALPEQELAHSQEQDGPASDCEEPLAIAAAIPDQSSVIHFIEVPLDAATWHALLVEPSWLHANQLQRMPAHTGTAGLNTCPESEHMALVATLCCLSSFLHTSAMWGAVSVET